MNAESTEETRTEDSDLRPRSISPPQRITSQKRYHSVDSPFFSGRTGRWDRNAMLKRVKPDPLEVMCKAFPSHGRDVLERIIQGCGGNVVQAVECVLENEGPVPIHAPIPIMPNPSLPPVMYSSNGGMLRNHDGFSPVNQIPTYNNHYQPVLSRRASPQAFLPYPPSPAERNQSMENGDRSSVKSKNDAKKIYCTNCGHKFQDNDNFCGNCGQRITWDCKSEHLACGQTNAFDMK